jgi:pyrroloquinoline quinone (PQQ) biosynthesis protein C
VHGKVMKFFLDLVTRTDEARHAFESHPVVIDAVANGMALDSYRNLLLELYHVVWHFNPVCARAVSRMGDTHAPVRHFLYDHMNEEKGHEDWVLNDLECLGLSRETSRKHAPGIDTLALIGYNHWAADHRHPCSALGMVYALEVIASVYGGPFANATKERLLLEDDRGVSFISSHATLDAQHMAQLREILNHLEDEPSRGAVVESAQVNFHHFARILEAA